MQNLIFDWSGIISDDRRTVYNAIMEVLGNFGKPTMGLDEFFAETVGVAQKYLRIKGVPGNYNTLFGYYEKALKHTLEKGIVPTVYPNVNETLRILHNRNKRLSILSSHPEERLKEEAKNYGIVEYFDEIDGSVFNKLKCLKKVVINPSETVYVGDMVQDIRAAKKAGIMSAAIATGYHDRDVLEKESPDFLLSRFSDLKNIV